MRDLDLWRALTEGADPAAQLEPLRALAGLPLRARAPFVPRVAALVDHADGEVRAAAIAALAGATGVAGLRAIACALDDDDGGVRAAAVAALGASASHQPLRFAHALFHHRDDVRQAALALPPPIGARQLGAYLRADPACSELARACEWPKPALALALDLHRRGATTDDELAELVRLTPPSELANTLAREHGRGADQVDAYLGRARAGELTEPPPGTDALRALFEALGAANAAAPAIGQLAAAIALRKPTPLTRRAQVALLGLAVEDRLAPHLLELLVALDPRVIGYPFFRRAMSPAAARGLHRYRGANRPPPDQVRKLLAKPVLVDDHGVPDLELATAVAAMLPTGRLAAIEDQFGVEPITRALLASDRGWDVICTLPPESPARDRGWLERVGKVDAARFCELAGLTLGHLAGDLERCRHFSQWLPRDVRAPAVLALARATASGRLALGDRRLTNLGRAIGARLTAGDVINILGALCEGGDPGRLALSIKLARELPEKLLMAAIKRMHVDALADFLAAATPENRLPWARELAIAGLLSHHTDTRIRTWVREVRVAFSRRNETPERTTAGAARALTDAEYDRIASCAIGNLEAALAPALAAPVTGLAGALAERDPPPGPHLAACAALLGCGDPMARVAAELERFGTDTEAFDEQLNGAAMRWLRSTEVAPLAHAMLFRWEAHKYLVLTWVGRCDGAARCLEYVAKLPGTLARTILWRAISSGLQLLRYREPLRLDSLIGPELGPLLAGEVDQPWGVYAARALVTLVEAGHFTERLPEIRDEVLDRAAGAAPDTRELLRRLIRLDGVPIAARAGRDAGSPDELAEVRASREPDVLVGACRSGRTRVVEEAVLRLIELGREDRLAELTGELPVLPHPVPIIESIPLWDSADALAAVRALALDRAAPAQVRYHLAVALCERGDSAMLAAALDAAVTDDDDSWYRRGDFTKLTKVADPRVCARALARSPHYYAHLPAMKLVVAVEDPEPADAEAARAFLDAGTSRPLSLRRRAARFLLARFDDLHGLPILLEMLADPDHRQLTEVHLLSRTDARRVGALIADMALVGGAGVCGEDRALAVLAAIPGCHALTGVWTALLHGASTGAARKRAAKFLSTAADKGARLRRVAEVFAWGVKRGVELTGRIHRIHMTAGEAELGYTYLTESRVFVSPLPLLRGERHGRDVVEGLILHELGHQVYHRDDRALELWKEAAREGLQPLLNLVMDEHLERNLRAVRADYGDRLKRLDAYAFQHAEQEIALEILLRSLRGAAADALIATELGVAFDDKAVRIRRGTVLAELARRGHPLARFARALRMGLGNRENDDVVETALALFDRGFRHHDADGLYAVTRQLAELFGGAIAIAEVFGGSEGLTWSDRDGDVHGGGFDDDELQKEVERILDPRGDRAARRDGDGGGRLVINVSPDEQFERIANVVRVRGDGGRYREVASRVKRHATRLRAHLDDLGLRWLPVGARVQGRALDRGRLRQLVVRRDPRILIARQPRRYSDLFIGVAIDCSGSMQVGDNMARARDFAILLSEATRPLRGVDVRLFGFTDQEIYDAGTQHDVDVTALEAGGGNNDAAALLHIAEAAARSRRRARVLVMISDGLPTECSVAALRGLVRDLGRRRGMLCAQVAVRPLEEVCFPHYVVIDDANIDVSVARFGRIIADLVRRSMSS